MKLKEPRMMEELHKIRIRRYEETKHLTNKEKAEKINKEAEEILKKYGMLHLLEKNREKKNRITAKVKYANLEIKEPRVMQELHRIREQKAAVRDEEPKRLKK
jgi:hypothetical protein